MRADLDIKINQYESALQKLVNKLTTEGHSMSQIQVKQLLDKITVLKREVRKLKSEQDILFFAYEYFSDDRNPENENNLIPAGVTMEQAPDFHRELCDMLNVVAWEEPTKNVGWSCPRGHAKSTYLSNVKPLYAIVFNLRHYILVISETSAMAERFIEFVADQLKYNKKLREDFGELLSPKKILNDKDNSEEFVTANGVKVQASSIGKALRGARHGAYRPDLVIMDDLESSKNTNTKELRDKNLHWFSSVVRPIGDPQRTAFIYMGTLVHPSGLLPAVLNMSDFSSKTYSAIKQYPERLDMWQHVEDTLKDVQNPSRLEQAFKYYEDNKEEMDKGVEVLWPARFTYFDLIRIKVDIGSRAFASEYLNKPADSEDAIFKSDKFLYFDERDLYDANGKKIRMDIVGFWDIAVGKNDRGDYNAIVTLGVEKMTGIIYVLDAWASKCPMHEALKAAHQKIKQYGHNTFTVETIAAQYDSYRQLKELCTKDRLYSTRVKSVTPRTKKEIRIEQLEPLFENGVIRLRKNQFLLIEMLEQYPHHDHDDLPDALAGAVEQVRSARKRVYYRKPAGM